jgi:hypothetical protein
MMSIFRNITAALFCLSVSLPFVPEKANAQTVPTNWDECYIACLSAGNRDANWCAVTCYDRFPDDGGEGGGKGKGPTVPFPCWMTGACAPYPSKQQ